MVQSCESVPSNNTESKIEQQEPELDLISTPEITWYIQCYKDYPEVQKCVVQLRISYPDSRVILCSDGDPDPLFPVLAKRYNLDYRLEKRLYSIDHGADIIHRMLGFYMEEPANYLIKIDPDTKVIKVLEDLPDPEEPFIAGTLQGTDKEIFTFPSIQGGCIIFSKKAATLLFRSEVFLSDRFKPPHLDWLPRPSLKRVEKGFTSFDWTIGWAAVKHSIPQIDLPSIRSTWRPTFFSLVQALFNRRIAIYHPRWDWNRKTMNMFMKSFRHQIDALIATIRNN